jgi:type VI secretion system secreted protein Hcp
VNKFLKLQGQTQGVIKGSVMLPGKEDSISVISISHELVSPRDPATGLPTGKRQHKPLAIVKLIDRSTPLLYRALVTNEKMTTFNLAFYVTPPGGQEVKQFTIDLVNANIFFINQVKQNSNSTPELMKFAEYEEVSFTYQKIIWTWSNGINDLSTSQDDWVSPI